MKLATIEVVREVKHHPNADRLDIIKVLGYDVTELLGVTKYEPALPANLQAKGGLPFNIPRTDEERWQNLRNLESLFGTPVDVTLKIDGQSGTYY